MPQKQQQLFDNAIPCKGTHVEALTDTVLPRQINWRGDPIGTKYPAIMKRALPPRVLRRAMDLGSFSPALREATEKDIEHLKDLMDADEDTPIHVPAIFVNYWTQVLQASNEMPV